MNQNHKYSFVIFSSLFLVVLFSCKKKDEITGVMALETYVNKTGHDMKITRYMKSQPEKSYDIAKDDTLSIESPLDAGADSTGTLFKADSAIVVFADGKKFSIKDTTNNVNNFLKPKRTISPSGKTHYFRYTFADTAYKYAQ